MRKFLADWRAFQDTVVWNPLCRYTILPAGIVFSMWLVALSVMVIVWYRDGGSLFWLNEDEVCYPACWVSGVAALLLTGRWMPTLIGFVFAISIASETFLNHGVNVVAIGLPLLTFGVVALWLISLDRGKFANGLALSLRMKLLVVLSAGFMILLLLAMVTPNFRVQSGALLSLSAGFWFTVFFDLIWRISYGWHIRTLHGLINAAVLWIVVQGLYSEIVRDYGNMFVPELIIGALSITVCLFWSHRAVDRDAGRRGEIPPQPIAPPAAESLAGNQAGKESP
jgi:hypothetical protein